MKVFLRFPTYSHLDKGLSAWWASLMYQMGLAAVESNNEVLPGIEISSAEIHWSTAGPDRARNDIVRSFLKTDATHLWMIDSDIVPPKNLDLLSYAKFSKKPLLSGVYYLYNDLMHTIAPFYAIYSALGTNQWTPLIQLSDSLTTIADAAGLGCILIERAVLENSEPPWFTFGETAAGDLIGEDFMFFQRAGRVCIYNPWVCQHVKSIPILGR